MQAVIGRVVVMLVLVAAGGGLWATGEAERKIAAGHTRLATLQYRAAGEGTADADGSLRYIGRVPAAGEALRGNVKVQSATAKYWLEQYGALTPARDASGAAVDPDPGLLFLAANAAYHTAAKADLKDRDAAVRALEGAMKIYVEVLKVNPGHADAAYNYEFVSRRRTALAQPRAAAVTPEPGVTIQGRPGAPPKTNFTKFKVVAPRRPDEREDPQAGRGEAKIRKG